MYFLYSGLTLLVLALGSPYFLYQALRHRKYVGGLRQRAGWLPAGLRADGRPTIWIHAVSVGEVLAARALVRDLRERYPDHRLVLSTTTATGQEVAGRLPNVDGVFFFPLDLGFVVRRTLERIDPRLLLIMETEIWPHVLRGCRRRGVGTVLVNGRLSDRSYRGYRLVRPLLGIVLGDIDRFCVQSARVAARLVALGALPAHVHVTGSVKFDAPPMVTDAATDPLLRLFRVRADRPVVIAASTQRGEDALVLRAFVAVRRRTPGAMLILAPRHPERFDEVEALARQSGVRVVRRSALQPDAALDADVVLLDTIGELARLYRIATVVFIGGSLVPVGGHNMIEPALDGKPIVFGPHMENFAEIADAFVRAEAAWRVVSAEELEGALETLLGDAEHRARLGTAARALVEASRGAKDRTLNVIAEILPPTWASASVPSGSTQRVPRRRCD